MEAICINGCPTVTEGKQIHGAPLKSWERFGLQKFPPVACDFKVDEKVIYTNEFGVSFEMDVVGFAKDTSFYGRFIHLVRSGTDGSGSAYWFPHSPEELKKIS